MVYGIALDRPTPTGVAEKRAGLRETGEIYTTHPLHAPLGFSCVSRQGVAEKGLTLFQYLLVKK